jgi:hypothetical protein
MISENHLVFLDEVGVSSVPMTRKRKLGWKLRIFVIRMIEEAREVDPPLHVMQQLEKDSHKVVLNSMGEKK